MEEIIILVKSGVESVELESRRAHRHDATHTTIHQTRRATEWKVRGSRRKRKIGAEIR